MKKITTLTLIVAFAFCTQKGTAQNTVASYFVADNNNQVVFEKSDNIYIKLAYSKNDVKVMWQTSVEKNTKSIEVQASNDGNNFETLQVVDAKNNTTKKSKYAIALNQQQTAPGKRVFRIKVNFNDGTAYFSQTVTYMMVLRVNTDNMVNAVNNDALYF
jgi:hypothetical protein